ncbi:hypothetical protein DSO57_1030614 [Entomophthora muscae]|uniref:Uncharacterized protein n=1 Tax=Entomophthora muscae TaxID=34485 RepID=A0ACC2UAC7_9FUNG|nr:hypothetical protein DSO57_1030614 [Entomophthora muscae]
MSIPSPSVARIWALEKSADSELTCTLGLDLQANTPHCFSLALRLFVQALKDNIPQLYLPLAVSVAHFMWYLPKVCSSSAVGFEGGFLEHFCKLAYQSKVSLPACYSYMEDVLLDCLTIGSAFSACGGWGCLVNESNLCLPLCSWTGMSRNSQLAWRQMLVALAFVCNQIEYDEYKLLLFNPPFPAGSVPFAGISNRPPGNGSSSSGSGRCSPE